MTEIMTWFEINASALKPYTTKILYYFMKVKQTTEEQMTTIVLGQEALPGIDLSIQWRPFIARFIIANIL